MASRTGSMPTVDQSDARVGYRMTTDLQGMPRSKIEGLCGGH